MKGVIVAAGYGTRLFPITKTIPKEMLPLLNKPAIEFIIDEFIDAGIREILIITSRRKKSLEDYFDREVELETVLTREKKLEKLAMIRPRDAEFYFVRQREMMGTGHALMLVEPFTGNDPFVVAYPDDIYSYQTPPPLQLMQMYEKTGCSVLSTLHNPPDLHRYGVLAIAPDNMHVQGIVEKPEPGSEPSREAAMGRYLFTSEIFKWLKEGYKDHKGGEFYHTHALSKLAEQGKLVYKQIEGTRLDLGDPAGYLRAILFYAYQNPELKDVLIRFRKENPF